MLLWEECVEVMQYLYTTVNTQGAVGSKITPNTVRGLQPPMYSSQAGQKNTILGENGITLSTIDDLKYM